MAQRTRLNEEYRQSIREAAINDTIRSDINAVKAECTAVGWEIIRHAYGDEVFTALQFLDDKERGGFLSKTSRVAFYPADGTHRQLWVGDWVPEPRGTMRIKDKALSERAVELSERQVALEQRYHRAIDELSAFLKRAKTFEELLEIWPDGKAYLDPVFQVAKGVTKASTALVSVPGLNAVLGLPKEVSANG